MAKVKMTIMASQRPKAMTLLWPFWWNIVMANIMDHSYGHHDVTLFWPSSEKTLLLASPWCNINRQLLSLGRHQEKRGWRRESKLTHRHVRNEWIWIPPFDWSCPGLFCGFFGVQLIVLNLKQRGFHILASGKDKYAPRIQRLVKSPPDKQKSSSGGFKSPRNVIQELQGWKASENLQRQGPPIFSNSNYHGSTVWLGTAWTMGYSTKFVHQIVSSRHVCFLMS